MTDKEELILKNIMSIKNIRIMKPDKGNGVVIVDYNDYISYMNAMLLGDAYEEVSRNEINLAHKKIDILLNDMLHQGELDELEWSFLQNEYPVISGIFGIPKIHKGLSNLQFRPIVDGKRSKTHFISQFLDYHFKKGINTFTHILKDSWDFLDKISTIKFNQGDIFVTMDVCNLFTVIPHDKGLEWLEEQLFYTNIYDQNKINVLTKLMDTVLKNNFLYFEGAYYRQIPKSVCSENCPVGYRHASRQGQPICCFDCIPCSDGEIANETGMTNCLKCPDDYWTNLQKDKCIIKAVEYLSYEDPLGIALVSTMAVLLLLNYIVYITFIIFRHTPVVRANNRQLSYLLLFALNFCFLSSVIFIGQPVKLTCMLRQAMFGIIFTLCISCVLAKTIVVVIAFSATKPKSNLQKWVGYKLPLCIVIFGVLFQFIICMTWLITCPPTVEYNTKTVMGKVLIECSEGSPAAFWCMLGYIGILASVSFVVAFIARKLPNTFNEAKYITFSMLVFVSVWVTFIPAYLSTKGKYMVALEVFAILSSSIGLLACIFFPKCYIIIFRPDQNTRKNISTK
ncbi:vomeronasal type-2 receptor 26-like [Protopterus annectens]|uniref:vomeronasal type-2 receptor 26-like n=1 Tax=Protopterus annectens TaxID=7888 RepID=UPI001CFA6953|nr:vomeronasal type-2 receptor 26-like [Protopterus annectens]